MNKIKVLFMGRKRVAAECLDWLVTTRPDVEVVGVLSDTHLDRSVTGDIAQKHGIKTFDFESALAAMAAGELSFDLGLSMLYWRKLKGLFLSMPEMGVVNFHPAPLPDFKGVGGYNLAILRGLDQWACTAHFVDDNIDTGDIIRIEKFPIDVVAETVVSLERKSQAVLRHLFEDVVSDFIEGGSRIERLKNVGGMHLSRTELEKMKLLDIQSDDIDRKVRAFWFPPYDGAFIEINGERYTLVNRAILRELADPNASSLFTPEVFRRQEGG